MVLVGDGRPEERHDPITHHLVDRAFVAVDGLHHPFEDGIQKLPGLFGVPVGQQLHRALEVREKHGHLLAFAFEGDLERENLRGEMARGVGLGRGGAGDAHGSKRGRALTAEPVVWRVGHATGGAKRRERSRALAAELGPRGVVMLAAGALHAPLQLPGTVQVETLLRA